MNARNIFSLFLLSLFAMGLFAQPRPLKFQGYAVDRNALPIADTSINAKFIIYDNDEPNYKYEEEQELTADIQGVFSATVGSGPIYNNLNFHNRDMWMRVQVQKTAGGTDYNTISNARLSSVPYAVSAENAAIVGQIILFAGPTDKIPAGWMLCNGASLVRTAYPRLFAVIGTIYGGSGTNFTLPNLNGRIPVGYNSADTPFNALGKVGGSATHTLTISQMASHSHGSSSLSAGWAGSHSHTISDRYHSETHSNSIWGAGQSFRAENTAETTRDTDNAGNHKHGFSGTTESRGEGESFNIMQPYMALFYIIRVY